MKYEAFHLEQYRGFHFAIKHKKIHPFSVAILSHLMPHLISPNVVFTAKEKKNCTIISRVALEEGDIFIFPHISIP